MSGVAALVVGLLLAFALCALLAFQAGVPILAIIVGSAIAMLLTFYLITNALVSRAAAKKPVEPVTPPPIHEKDHIS